MALRRDTVYAVSLLRGLQNESLMLLQATAVLKNLKISEKPGDKNRKLQSDEPFRKSREPFIEKEAPCNARCDRRRET